MVAISRVFDVEGLWEVLGEVGHEQILLSNEKGNPVFEGSSPPWATQNLSPEKPPQVLDSEDDEEVEISPIKAPRKEKATENEDEGMEMVIVDNMTQIINELFGRREKNEAHALLASLSRTIHTLSHSQNTLTILHNTTTSSPYTNTYAQSKHTLSTMKSVFEANPVKPSLGVIFSQFVELHVLISKIPKGKRDAEILYGQDDDIQDNVGISFCYVAEILKDETTNPTLPLSLNLSTTTSPSRKRLHSFGAREQKWTALDLILDPVTGEATGLKNSFMEKGNMRGMGLERRGIDRGFGTNIRRGEGIGIGIVGGADTSSTGPVVGNVAKIHGFGGRRV